MAWNNIVKELDKCQLLCCMCHRWKDINPELWLFTDDTGWEHRISDAAEKPVVPKSTEIVHGTSNAYQHKKCRCDLCKKMHNSRIRIYNSKNRNRRFRKLKEAGGR